MPKEKKDVKVLLIQIREDEIKDHEFKIIVENSGLAPENFVVNNVFFDEPLEMGELDQYDGVIIGGSGSCSVIDEHDFDEFLENTARYCREKEIPFFGLCYGMQVAVKALGGKVIRDKASLETGMYMMYRDEKSDNDPVIGKLPHKFLAGCGRKDRAETLPEGMVNLVWSDLCPYHYIKFPRSNFCGTQFHPELWKKEDNLIRIHHYKDKYGLTEEQLQEQLKMFEVDAPESKDIIKNFIDAFVLN